MRLKFFSHITNYFAFSRSQQAGLIIMFILIILIFLANLFVPYFYKNEEITDDGFLAEIEAFRNSIVREEASTKIIDPFPFDPNVISYDQMIQLGLSDYQAKMIMKFREAGGKFYDKEDFRKIYSITEDDYDALRSFIIITKPDVEVAAAKTEKKLIPRPFNPNDADSLLLSKIGLNSKQIGQIVNYRNAGGEFRIKSDFNKIYSISDNEYEVLQKYILLPSVIDSSEFVESRGEQKDNFEISRPIVEINSADTSELDKLYGIGPYYAKKIVAYREKLGGFYDKSQLLEVFGIDSTRYFKFEEQVEIDQSYIQQLDLNDAGFNEMLKHPYLEYYLVKAIFNYKDATGDFKSINELKQIDLLYDELFNKIEPYFTIKKATGVEKNED